MRVLDRVKDYWQVPAALCVAAVAVFFSDQSEPLPQILPDPEPDLVPAVVVREPIAAGAPIRLEHLAEASYPLAWMPVDAVGADDQRLARLPLAGVDLSPGTPVAAHMLMPNPMTGIDEELDAGKLFLPVPQELSRSLPRQLPPRARVSLFYESKVGSVSGTILSAIPVTRASEGEVHEVTWFLLDASELTRLQRGLRLGRVQLALCREAHCPAVSLTAIPEPIVTEKKTEKRASVTVGLS